MVRCVSASRPLPWFQSQIKEFIYFVPWGVYSLFPSVFWGGWLYPFLFFSVRSCILSSLYPFCLVSFRPLILLRIQCFMGTCIISSSSVFVLVSFLPCMSFLPNILASFVFSLFFSVFRGCIFSSSSSVFVLVFFLSFFLLNSSFTTKTQVTSSSVTRLSYSEHRIFLFLTHNNCRKTSIINHLNSNCKCISLSV